MSTDVKLLPLEIPTRFEFTRQEARALMRDYARANMEPLEAEIEALRAEVERLNKVLGPVSAEAIEMRHEAVAQKRRAERLAEALRWIASDDTAKGCDDGMQEVEAIKQRAHAALDQEGGKGGAGK